MSDVNPPLDIPDTLPEPPKNWGLPPEAAQALHNRLAESDNFLQTYVHMFNKTPDARLPVTLSVRGKLITGEMIAGRAYFDELNRTIFGEIEPEHPLLQLHKSFASIYDAAGDETPPPMYIHMRSARYVDGTTFSPSDGDGVLWRGKISSVDGFSFGSLQSTKSKTR